MGNVTIETIPNLGIPRRIDVQQSPRGRAGNLPVNPMASITWKAGLPSEIFRVFFYDPDLPDKSFWPFEEGRQGHPPDGYAGPGAHENPFLLVEHRAKPRKLKASALAGIKFDVIAMDPITGDPRGDVEPLDPVIIIRPATRSPDVAVGVTCAVIGAIVGAATAFSIMS